MSAPARPREAELGEVLAELIPASCADGSPVRRYGDTLVVLEGASRAIWARTGQASWSLLDIWPTEQQRAKVHALLAAGGSLLVVFDGTPPVVSALSEELTETPATVRALGDPDDDPVDLHVPRLDWLPERLRERGLTFLRSSEATVAAGPAALLPALLLDEPDAGAPNVRFARRTRPGALSDACIAELAEHLAPLGEALCGRLPE